MILTVPQMEGMMQQKFARNSLGVVAGLAMLGIASPTLASSDPSTPTGAAVKSVKPSEKTKYCVDSTTTGSRIARRTCLTEREWAAEGVDIRKEVEKSKRGG